MSRRIRAACYDVRGISALDRVLLFRFADQADDRGFVWLGQEELARAAEVDVRTVRRRLRRLEDQRVIGVVHPGGGRSRPTLYKLLPTVVLAVQTKRVEYDAVDAYERRFDVSVNPGNMSGLRGGETRTYGTLNPDNSDPKPGQSSVRRHSDTDMTREFQPRRIGESASEWLRRIHGESPNEEVAS